MTKRPVLILSSWGAGAGVVNAFLGECGAYLCPPFSPATNPKQITSESLHFRGIVAATIDEDTFEFKADANIFRQGFKRWYAQELAKLDEVGKTRISLMYPLSAFLLHEIFQVVNPLVVVITRPYQDIEKTRIQMGNPELRGKAGATRIYNQIFSYLVDNNRTFLTLSFSEFMKSEEARLKLLDYCDLNVEDPVANKAFVKIRSEN